MSVSLRRRLPPLLLRIHPDLFLQAPDEVRDTNLRCVQRINELADSLDRLSLSLGRVSHPLPAHLVFHCYFRGDTGEALRTARLSISTPRALTRVQSISPSVFSSAVDLTLHRFGGIFEQVGLANPWELGSASDEDEVELGCPKAAERAIRREAHSRAVQFLSERLMRASVSSAFSLDRPSKDTEVTPSAELEVDIYLKNGNVLIDKGLSPAEEVEAVRRLRSFLVEFSPELGFVARRWWDVIFLLRPPANKEYRCKHVAKRLFIELPCSFKNRRLLDCLIANVPQAQIFEDLDSI